MQFYNYSIKIMGIILPIDKIYAKNERDAKRLAKKHILSAIKLHGIILD